VAEDLFSRLDRMRIHSSPFKDRLSAQDARQVRFVRPELVAEIEFRGWTADGHLRHASFRGLREDKLVDQIVREIPKIADAPKPERRSVKLTHPDRLYWPDEGVTKEGLADYYTEVWCYIGPHIVGRPLALVRCPTGVTGEKFFQKHAWEGLNRNVVQVKDPKNPSEGQLISINDLDGLHLPCSKSILGIDRCRLGAAGHHHHRSRSGPKRALGGRNCGGHGNPRSP
jgi:bifunctional non-homologous end joining protein LigD